MAKSDTDGLYAFLLGAVIGGVVAGFAALLFAPRPGREFRQEIQHSLRHLPDWLENELEPESQARQWIDKTRYRFEDRVNDVSHSLQSARLAKAKAREDRAAGIELN